MCSIEHMASRGNCLSLTPPSTINYQQVLQSLLQPEICCEQIKCLVQLEQEKQISREAAQDAKTWCLSFFAPFAPSREILL